MRTAEFRAAPPAPASGQFLTRAGLVRGPRFTLDGDEALERHLAHTCARVLSGIRGLIPQRRLEAVLLGGGYGRGEGGVLRGPGGDRPYNDLEFYVAIRGSRHLNELRYRRRLQVLGEILTHLADVEVEFKVTSLAELAARPVSMFSYDLVCGHRTIWGDASLESLPAWIHHRRPGDIPPSEATRLLMNRCSGLLFARTMLEQRPLTPAAIDFVRRNIAKAQLACGDALLAAHGRYHWSCRERHRELQLLPVEVPSAWLANLRRHHAAGVEFKLHPESGPIAPEALIARHREVTELARQCWLWHESRRLGRRFASARAYAEDAVDKCPGSSRLLDFLLNLRADHLRPRARPNPWRHPRQRIFHSLALLLWEPAATTDPKLRRRVGAELNARATTAIGWTDAYRALWCRVQ
jgi:hypothetical protein